jgi:hypothetical protein
LRAFRSVSSVKLSSFSSGRGFYGQMRFDRVIASLFGYHENAVKHWEIVISVSHANLGSENKS